MAICAVLTGCTAVYAPVVDKYGVDSNRAPVTRGVHVVRAEETLYSIAWRYGWDFKVLATANNIRAPYTIFPGQAIRLDRTVSTVGRAQTAAARSTTKPSTTTSTSKSKPARPSPAKSASVRSGPLTWQWPATGDVISRYSSAKVGRHGIAISGRDGDPIRAAGQGIVVYRGNGLTGYGNLLIIKHNERWLSAYAHNEKILVKEGQPVKAGEQIATMGATGTFRTQLHFEVRRDGSPIDPMTVLPGK